MFLLGHLGIGERMGRRFTAPSAKAALFLGCVLPDLVDKPLYYALTIITGRRSAELGLISGTRTIGHTLLFAIACWMVCRFAADAIRARALFVGMLTHFVLDAGGELWARIGNLISPEPASGPPGPNIFNAFFFPLLGPHFPVSPFHSVVEHLLTLKSGYVLFGEIAGGVLLILDWRDWKRTRASRSGIASR